MEKAPDPHQDPRAKSALQAIRYGNEDELRKLLLDGIDPNAIPTSETAKEATNTLLYHTIAKQDIALATLLLDHGADANGMKSEGYSPLRAAMVRNNVALIKLLLDRGADVNHHYTVEARDRKVSKTVLFETAMNTTYELMLKCGADVHARNSFGDTPLHSHSYNWNSRLVRTLVSGGANVNAVNKKNLSPLDSAIFRKPSQRRTDDEEFMEVCRILLKNKVAVSWSHPDEYFRSRIKPDMDANAVKARLRLVFEWECQRKAGDMSFKLPIEVFRRGDVDIMFYFSALDRDANATFPSGFYGQKTGLLYMATERGAVDMVTLLLDNGATADGSDEIEVLPPLLAAVKRDNLELVELLRSHGANINKSYTLILADDSEVARTVLFELSSVEVFSCLLEERADVHARDSSERTPLHEHAANLKEDTSRLLIEAGADVNAVDENDDTPLDAAICSFWIWSEDFIRVCHLFINLDLYSKTLDAAAMDSDDEPLDNSVMDAFMELHIFKWVRMICAHHPQAEFAFLGTKADLVKHDPKKIREIQQDVVSRFKLNVRRMKDRVERALMDAQNDRLAIQEADVTAKTKELDEKIAGCEEILRKQPVLLSQEFIVFSSADMKYKNIAIGKMKALMLMSGRAVKLPPSYAELLKYTQQKRVSGQKNQMRIQEQVDTAFLPVKTFVDSVVQSSQLSIPKEEIVSALHLLHDTGDILWFDGLSKSQVLQERLFLDPMLVIDFIRQIVNHKIATDAALDGAVRHSVLQSLPYWKDVSTSTTHQLKLLLLHLHLAYPAGKATMISWNSDLVVPVYWKLAPGTKEPKSFPTEEDKVAGLIERVRWEYSFEPAIPENLFEKLAVVTYSPLLLFERSYTRSSFTDRLADKCSALVDKDAGSEGSPCALSITVVARERTLAWKQLVWYCMNMENVLKTYPGLLVTRSTVNPRGRYYDVDQLLSDQDHVKQLIAGSNQEILPFDMQWYTNRSCELQPVTFTDIEKADLATQAKAPAVTTQGDISDRALGQIREHFDASIEKVLRGQIALITGMNNKAKFPSLWTLEYQGFDEDDKGMIAAATKKVTTTVVVKFRSDLTGKCHHDGIPISVAKEVFAGRFGECLKVGLTLLSAAVPDFFGVNVVEFITDECKEQLDRAAEFHGALKLSGVAENLAAGPQRMDENRELSPSEILDLLRCLLQIHDKNFQTDDIPQLSGLTCGVMVNPTRYIWASLDEILLNADIIVDILDNVFAMNDQA
ncbi:Vps9-Ankyrin repeat-containing protein [Phytophthora cinnamomi]|uniref:Vps9-Ankyrin repeat-containing protein n=1 Tax=Phytophthora cinnamomi TaxID=4785 RepID=UPI003559730B|nr:Vps9-Ankyrin repeat-containing protein [Phytophthora cinnamomi]